MAADGSERALIERVLARPVAAATRLAPDVPRIVADRLHAMLS
jgi:hypothetical protein